MPISANRQLKAVCQELGFTVEETAELSGNRDRYLTGTDLPILAGVAPPTFGTPEEVINAKIHGHPRKFRSTRRMELGSLLEDFMACEYVRTYGAELKAMGADIVAIGKPISVEDLEIMATLDLAFMDCEGNVIRIVEIKTTGEESLDNPPERMVIQSAWQNWVARERNKRSLFPSTTPPEQHLYVQQDLDPPKLFALGQDDTLDAAFETLAISMAVAKNEGDPSLVVLPDIVLPDKDPDKPKPLDAKGGDVESDESFDAVLELYLANKEAIAALEEANEPLHEAIKAALVSRGSGYLSEKFRVSGYYRKNGGSIDWESACKELLDTLGLSEKAIKHHRKSTKYSLNVKAERVAQPAQTQE